MLGVGVPTSEKDAVPSFSSRSMGPAGTKAGPGSASFFLKAATGSGLSELELSDVSWGSDFSGSGFSAGYVGYYFGEYMIIRYLDP